MYFLRASWGRRFNNISDFLIKYINGLDHVDPEEVKVKNAWGCVGYCCWSSRIGLSGLSDGQAGDCVKGWHCLPTYCTNGKYNSIAGPLSKLKFKVCSVFRWLLPIYFAQTGFVCNSVWITLANSKSNSGRKIKIWKIFYFWAYLVPNEHDTAWGLLGVVAWVLPRHWGFGQERIEFNCGGETKFH